MAENKAEKIEVLQDLLLLVGVEIDATVIASWTPEQWEQAENWAVKAFWAASGHRVQVPSRPLFLSLVVHQ